MGQQRGVSGFVSKTRDDVGRSYDADEQTSRVSRGDDKLPWLRKENTTVEGRRTA